MRYYRILERSIISVVLVLSGLAVLVAIPAHTGAACSALPTDRGTVTATVNIQTAGTYRVWSRIKAPDTTNNSFLMQVDDTTCNVVVGDSNSIPANTWTWVDYQNGTSTSKINLTNLTAGNHVFTLAGREDNVQLDRVILTQDLNCTPINDGNNCSDPTDVTGPATSITQPTAGATISGTAYNVTATATDPSGISKVELFIDNSSTPAGTDTSSPYSFAINTTTLSNASHSFKVVATDNSPAKNTTTSASVNATVNNAVPDTTGPTTSVTAPTAGATITGNFTMTASATDASGINKVEFYIDDSLKTTVTSAPFSYAFNSANLSNGSHTFKVITTDNSPNKNTTTSAVVTATISNTTGGVRDEDINSDGLVDIRDFSLLSKDFGKTGGAIVVPRTDINKDGLVDIRDFSLLSKKFGT